MATMKILNGSLAGQSVPVSRAKLVIGREVDCDLPIDSDFVSRHHCVLLLDDYTLRIRDLGSKNGTFVNGHRIGAYEMILLHDDLVTVGVTTLLIDFSGHKSLTPPAEKAAAIVAPALQGTGLFDGDTAVADSSSDIPQWDSSSTLPKGCGSV
jgi:pSer/pThr/pTyr-binding forkhead associated (FHA) protein